MGFGRKNREILRMAAWALCPGGPGNVLGRYRGRFRVPGGVILRSLSIGLFLVGLPA